MPGKKFIVVTSINGPSEAISGFAAWDGWELVVVGDRKTPRDWHCEGVTYLGIEEQYDTFGALARAIPENTYARKLLGYAYATRNGALAILESDDDNIPYRDAAGTVDTMIASAGRTAGRPLRSPAGWINTYRQFGAAECWPRGFPLELVRDPGAESQPGRDNLPWAVAQYLADDDPDVDAVYRMISGKAVRFARERGFTLDRGTYCPINSQATLWLPQAFPMLFLPLGVTDRVMDILRGYACLACLWRIGHTAFFGSPIVYQKRNAHSLSRDFEQEIPLYLHARRWSQQLLQVTGGRAVDCFSSALDILSGSGVIPGTNGEAYRHFLEECRLPAAAGSAGGAAA